MTRRVKRKRIVPLVKGETIGTYLRSERARVGLSQREMAERLGVSHTYISHLEADRRIPSMELLQNFVGVTLRTLVVSFPAQ